MALDALDARIEELDARIRAVEAQVDSAARRADEERGDSGAASTSAVHRKEHLYAKERERQLREKERQLREEKLILMRRQGARVVR